MKYLLAILLAIFIISCGNNPTAQAPDTGGTSIEVAMIKGVVVDEQNRPVEGATVEIIRQIEIPDSSFTSTPDSSKTDSQGKFSETVTSRGALSVIIKDTSGNGAFKPCTLSTNDTIIDLDTIKLERLGSLEITLATIVEGGNVKPSDFYVWFTAIGEFYYFDSTGVDRTKKDSLNYFIKDSTHVINIKSQVA